MTTNNCYNYRELGLVRVLRKLRFVTTRPLAVGSHQSAYDDDTLAISGRGGQTSSRLLHLMCVPKTVTKLDSVTSVSTLERYRVGEGMRRV